MFILGLVISGAVAVVCMKHRKFCAVSSTLVFNLNHVGQNEAAKEQLDNQQNAEAQRERYYATIHKVTLQAGEKIPGVYLYYIISFLNNDWFAKKTTTTETSEDISPYATFQLSEPSTLPQNTMLHSFMYHEHAMTEGCASPPPASSSVQRNSPYYNIVGVVVRH